MGLDRKGIKKGGEGKESDETKGMEHKRKGKEMDRARWEEK